MKGSMAAMTDPEMFHLLPAWWLLSCCKLKVVKPVKNPEHESTTSWPQTAKLTSTGSWILTFWWTGSHQPANFEFQRRPLALRSKAMFPMTSPARCSNSVARPPVTLMTISRLFSRHRMVPLSQSRCRSWISSVVLYSCCEYWPLTVVLPMTLRLNDTQ